MGKMQLLFFILQKCEAGSWRDTCFTGYHRMGCPWLFENVLRLNFVQKLSVYNEIFLLLCSGNHDYSSVWKTV